MSEFLKTTSQTKMDPLLELNEFYRKFVLRHLENAEDYVQMLDFVADSKIAIEDFEVMSLFATDLAQSGKYFQKGEVALLGENAYLLLVHQLVEERSLIDETTKLIPEVFLTYAEGFIVGTQGKPNGDGTKAFFVGLGNFQIKRVPKSHFPAYESFDQR